MKMKGLVVGALIAVMCVGFAQDAGAHGKRWRQPYPPRRPHPVFVAPPRPIIPPPVVVVGPRYRYYQHRHPRPHYVHPGRHRGHYAKPYAYHGPRRRW